MLFLIINQLYLYCTEGYCILVPLRYLTLGHATFISNKLRFSSYSCGINFPFGFCGEFSFSFGETHFVFVCT